MCNAIVLVDRINRNRAGGLDLEEAILEAGGTRLRPILMTTATTVLGMLPLTGCLAPRKEPSCARRWPSSSSPV